MGFNSGFKGVIDRYTKLTSHKQPVGNFL